MLTAANGEAKEEGGGTEEDARGWRPPPGMIITTPQISSFVSFTATTSKGGFRLQWDDTMAA